MANIHKYSIRNLELSAPDNAMDTINAFGLGGEPVGSNLISTLEPNPLLTFG